MAVLNPPGFLQNAGATHTAEQLRNWHGLLIAGLTGATALTPRGGVHPGLGNALAVTQTGSPSMAVVVKSGQGVIPGSEVSRQGAYSVLNDADVTLSIAPAHATLNRIDIVVFKVEDSAYSGAVNASSLVVITGTPASSPAAPSAPANSIVLASVSILANDTAITNAEITDLRQFIGAVGGVVPVANQAERDALVAYESLTVYRRDTDTIEVYTGSSWVGLVKQSNFYTAKQTLGADVASTTINIPSTLDTVRITCLARCTHVGLNAGLAVRINGSSSAVYDTRTHGSTGTSEAINATSAVVGVAAGTTATAGAYSPTIIDIAGWSGPHNSLTFVTETGDPEADYAALAVSRYKAAGPYTSVTLLASSGNLVAGSVFYVSGFAY